MQSVREVTEVGQVVRYRVAVMLCWEWMWHWWHSSALETSKYGARNSTRNSAVRDPRCNGQSEGHKYAHQQERHHHLSSGNKVGSLMLVSSTASFGVPVAWYGNGGNRCVGCSRAPRINIESTSCKVACNHVACHACVTLGRIFLIHRPLR